MVVVFDWDGTLYHGNYTIGSAKRVLTKLSKEYKLAIYSRSTSKDIIHVLKFDKFKPSVAVIGNSVFYKPDPRAMQMIATTLNEIDLIMVGDTYHDLQAARNYGCPCIIVRNPSLDWIPVGADYYINSLEELPELLESIK